MANPGPPSADRGGALSSGAGEGHDRRMRSIAALIALLPLTAAAAPRTGSVQLEYDGYAHGLIALKLDAAFTLTDSGYSGRLRYHTAGFVGFMVKNESDSQVTGRFTPAGVDPIRFDSTGELRGRARVARFAYVNGVPRIEALDPPVEQERTPVSPADTAHTIDTLSSMAALVRQVSDRGTCDGTVTTFDGRRVTRMVAHTSGHEALARTPRSRFAGDTLRCDFDGTQLAGFVKNQDEAELRKTRHGTAWVAPIIPGAPPVPVRVVFDNRVLGEVTLYLTSARGGPGG